MKRNQQTTSIAPYPGNYVPGTRFPEVEPPRHNVVNATNAPSPASVLGLGYAAIFVLAIVGIIAMSLQTGWRMTATTLFFLPIVAVVVILVLIIVSGDFVAWLEVRKNDRLQKTAIDRHADILTLEEENRHTETMAEIDVKRLQVEVDGRLTSIQHQLNAIERRQLTVGDGPTATPAAFVDADPHREQARNVAQRYAMSLYKPTGEQTPRPELVHGKDAGQPGRLKERSPLSKRFRWPDDVPPEVGERAAELLARPDRGQPPVIVEVRNGYALNLDAYPTRGAITSKFQ